MATLVQAVRMALHHGEEHLGVTEIFGEDVGPPLGGVFTVTQNLKKAWNSPLDERGIIGAAIGLALAGQRCVAEIQFSDYIFNTVDLLKQAGMFTWATNGQFSMPMVVMTPNGSGVHGAIYHSHSMDSMITNLPGWKIVQPSRPTDAYGLMVAALKEQCPVMYMIPKGLLRVKDEDKLPNEPDDEALKKMIDAPIGAARASWKPQWPDIGDYSVPIGQAALRYEGTQATIVSTGRTQVLCEGVVKALMEERGYSIDCIDLRTLYPYDWNTIKNSVMKTRRVLFVNEDHEITNFAEHLLRRTVDEMFYDLAVRPRILAGAHTPGVGLNPRLENATVPQSRHIKQALIDLIEDPA